ncbi:MAG: hypothetical protein ACQKBW_07210 [Puniceicoccales bacterium]
MDAVPASQERVGGALRLLCPDWSQIEHELHLREPFVLWPVGDQPLLYHWFDHALDQGYDRVVVVVLDRPNDVRRAVAAATLWPLPIEVSTVSHFDDNPDGVWVDTMPGQGDPEQQPADGWELLDYWFSLQMQWLDHMVHYDHGMGFALGRYCRIHPTAELVPPYYLGNQVAIGPGAQIGPYAVIGEGSIISEGTQVQNAQVMPHSYLGPQLSLKHSILTGGIIINRNNRVRLDRLESFIAGSVDADQTKPPMAERLEAFGWWLRFRLKSMCAPRTQGALRLHTGQVIRGEAAAPLWLRRMPQLREVVRGRMRLYGPLPRTKAQLDRLDPQWQSILRDAPAGVFSYADCLGCHHPEDPEEGLHAVYQATHPEPTREQCRGFLHSLLTRTP